MTDTKDGGPAFPHGPYVQCDGMSLRDYFAGQALVALTRCYAAGEVDGYLLRMVAADAYTLADAMLEQRMKGQGDD